MTGGVTETDGQPRLVAIWRKRVRRGPMDPLDEAELVADHGLSDNANVRGKRQVTVISSQAWDDVCRELGDDVDPRLRRANLMVSGLELEGARGRVLRVGDCRIAVGGETRPCRLMDDQHPGLQQALDPHWRGGVFGQVLTGGPIRVGDPVAFEQDELFR